MSAPAPALALPEDCGLDWVLHMHEELQNARETPVSPRIDISALNRITTPAMQLISAFFKAAAERGQRGEIIGQSGVFDAALADLGLSVPFEQWSIRVHG